MLFVRISVQEHCFSPRKYELVADLNKSLTWSQLQRIRSRYLIRRSGDSHQAAAARLETYNDMRSMARQFAAAVGLLVAMTTQAHDPVFGLGPHVLFKNGTEAHAGVNRLKGGRADARGAAVRLLYGITGDWTAGVKVPYITADAMEESASGAGPVSIMTKYRFWRNDMPGVQESASVFGKVILDNGDKEIDDRGGSDYLLGLTYGHEARKWYRWGSVRRRFNANADSGAKRPDIWLVDLVAGIRFIPTEYLEPDWVWMIELNGEIGDSTTDRRNGKPIRLGGGQWFLSPGLMWTYRNVAIKTGVQFLVWDDLAGDQNSDDYRTTLEIEWHF